MKLLLHIITTAAGTPPRPSRPTVVAVKGNTVTVEWSQSVCDGGHIPQSYTLRYKRSSSFSSYSYRRQITEKRLKITGLSYSTSYQFSVSTLTVDSRTSSYSSAVTISTLPRGINNYNNNYWSMAINNYYFCLHCMQLLLHHVMSECDRSDHSWWK